MIMYPHILTLGKMSFNNVVFLLPIDLASNLGLQLGKDVLKRNLPFFTCGVFSDLATSEMVHGVYRPMRDFRLR